MPSAWRPEASLLRVEVPALHKIDTSSVENLFGMWSLFSKTSHAMDEGKRLENLSWRLWNRETFCTHPQSQARSTASPPISLPPKPRAGATDIPMPALSSSLDSASSEDDEEAPPSPHSTTIPKARAEFKGADSFESRSRGFEKHITPVDLEKIVIAITETKELEPKPIELPVSTPAIQPEEPMSESVSQELSQLQLTSAATSDPSSNTTPHAPSDTQPPVNFLESSASTFDTNDDNESQTVGSESSSNTEMSEPHSIIRGFVPGGAPSSYRSQTNLSVRAQPTPILKASPQNPKSHPKKKGAMFTIGTSSGEDESSLESHMFKSALSESLKKSTSNLASCASRKQTSFKDEVAIGRAAEHSPVFESDDEDEEVSESAIEDSAIDDDDEDEDDSSEWEDSEDQSGASSVNDRELFQRVDSRPNLTSRRSLLTTQLHEPDRAKALANAASRSTPAIRRSRQTTPNGPSIATSPEPNVKFEVPEAVPKGAKPIIMTTSNTINNKSNNHDHGLSPRTTRRNMLSTELTESLRKNLLWERQHRSTGNLGALRRRHTSTDVKNLKQQPEPAPILSHQDGGGKHRFTNDYFHAGLQEYHAKGW